jgi:Tol biopolymer transport system component
MSELTRRLRATTAPGEDEAFRRARELAMAAVRTTPPRRMRRRRVRALAPLAAALLVAGVLLSPAGADVRSWISDAVTSSHPEPVRAQTLPGGGRLLTAGRDGLFVRSAHGPRRIFGDVGEAAWSPRGLFVIATRGIELIAVSPQGARRWSLHHDAPIRHPRWAPSGYQIAYLSGGAVYLVDGDGSDDAPLGAADGAAPAWRPVRGGSQLAYTHGRTVVLSDAIDRRILFRVRVARRPLALSWSADGQRLLVVERDRIQLLDQSGANLRTSRAPHGTRNVTGTFAPRGRDWTLVRAQGDSSRLLLVSGQDTLKVLELAGAVDGITYSPSGHWLALGVGRSVWLVRPGYHAGLRGVHTVPAHGRLMDWAP